MFEQSREMYKSKCTNNPPMKIGSDAPLRSRPKKLRISQKNRVRLEGAKETATIVATRNPPVRIVKDSYDLYMAIQKMKTGRRRKTIFEKIQNL